MCSKIRELCGFCCKNYNICKNDVVQRWECIKIVNVVKNTLNFVLKRLEKRKGLCYA